VQQHDVGAWTAQVAEGDVLPGVQHHDLGHGRKVQAIRRVNGSGVPPAAV
jgi:hypothetical protein